MSEPRDQSYLPLGESGSQSYTKSKPATAISIQGIIPRVLQAIDSIPYRYERGRPFTICDYGAMDGGMTTPLIQACVERVRELHGPETEVHVIYEDLPTNDFGSVFRIPQEKKVFASVVGKSFYEQCSPTETVHLGFSSMAVHWLSQRPCMIPEAVYANSTKDSTARRKFSAQARTDWYNFIAQRAKELVAGGQLVLSAPTVDEDTGEVPVDALFRVQENSWKDLFQKGIITENEYTDGTAYMYVRDRSEYLAPFTTDSPKDSLRLELLSSEAEKFSCGFRDRWDSTLASPAESSKAFAKSLVSYMHQWSHFIFTGALSPSRSPKDIADIIQQYLQQAESMVDQAPERFLDCHTNMLMLVIRKSAP